MHRGGFERSGLPKVEHSQCKLQIVPAFFGGTTRRLYFVSLAACKAPKRIICGETSSTILGQSYATYYHNPPQDRVADSKHAHGRGLSSLELAQWTPPCLPPALSTLRFGTSFREPGLAPRQVKPYSNPYGKGFGFTLSQLGHARRGSQVRIGVTLNTASDQSITHHPTS